VEDFQILREELSLYQGALLDRPSLIFGNKQDLRSRSRAFRKNLERVREVSKLPVICGSAKTGANLPELVDQLRQAVDAQNVLGQEIARTEPEKQHELLNP